MRWCLRFRILWEGSQQCLKCSKFDPEIFSPNIEDLEIVLPLESLSRRLELQNHGINSYSFDSVRQPCEYFNLSKNPFG